MCKQTFDNNNHLEIGITAEAKVIGFNVTNDMFNIVIGAIQSNVRQNLVWEHVLHL